MSVARERVGHSAVPPVPPREALARLSVLVNHRFGTSVEHQVDLFPLCNICLFIIFFYSMFFHLLYICFYYLFFFSLLFICFLFLISFFSFSHFIFYFIVFFLGVSVCIYLHPLRNNEDDMEPVGGPCRSIRAPLLHGGVLLSHCLRKRNALQALTERGGKTEKGRKRAQ